MNGYQDVDAMWEADAAAEWERLNDCESDHFPHWKSAENKMVSALRFLSDALDLLTDAAQDISGSSQEDRIDSLADDVSKIYDEVYQQKERMGWL